MKKLMLLLLLSVGPAVVLRSMEEKYAGEYASALQDSWCEKDDVTEGSGFLESYQTATILDKEAWQQVQEQITELLSEKIKDSTKEMLRAKDNNTIACNLTRNPCDVTSAIALATADALAKTDWSKLPREIKLYIISFLPSKVEKIKTFLDYSLVNHDFASLISACPFAEIKKYEFPGQKKITINDIFVKAAEKGHYSIVKTLITRGVKAIDIYEGNALSLLNPRNWRKDIAKLLIEAGAVEAIDDVDNTPLIRAAANGHTKIILLLMFNYYGPYINNADSRGRTPLILAAMNGHAETAEIIIACGGNTNNHDNRGNTPLMVAACHGHKEVCQLLLGQDANVNSTSNDMFTPLISAAQNGHAMIVKQLIEHGANIEAQNSNGNTPLICAAREGHTEIIKLLLAHNANPNAKIYAGKTAATFADGTRNNAYNDGYTPLIYAAQNGHVEIVKMLITNRANVNAHTTSGITALICAALQGHQEIVKLLIDCGANISW